MTHKLETANYTVRTIRWPGGRQNSARSHFVWSFRFNYERKQGMLVRRLLQAERAQMEADRVSSMPI